MNCVDIIYDLQIFGMENDQVRRLKDDENVEETHLYINENGAMVDETLFRDRKNEILILNVPAHHDRVENQVVFDENSVS